MSVTIVLPRAVAERLRKKAREEGVTLSEYVIELLSKELSPEDRAKEYIRTALEITDQVLREVERGDLRQISERIWEAAALAIKAYAYAIEGRRLINRGELWQYKDRVAREIGDWIHDAWAHATEMHVNYYEGWATRETVEKAAKRVREMIEAILNKLERKLGEIK